jgi:hypothetical protein
LGPTRIADSIVNGILQGSIGKNVSIHLTRADRKRFTTQSCIFKVDALPKICATHGGARRRAANFRLMPRPLPVNPAITPRLARFSGA